MKLLFLFLIIALTSVTHAQEVPVAKQIEAHKAHSKVAYKRIKSGFEFKGYLQSPGHNAILEQMKSFYQSMVHSQKIGRTDEDIQKSWVQMQNEMTRIKKLATYVVIDKEVLAILNEWVKRSQTLLKNNTIKEQQKISVLKKNQAMKRRVEAARIAKINKANEQKLVYLTSQNSTLRRQSNGLQAGYYAPNTDIYDAANTFNTNGQYVNINGRVYYVPLRSGRDCNPRYQQRRNPRLNIHLNF